MLWLVEDAAPGDPGVVREGEAEGHEQEVEEGVVAGQHDHHHHHYLEPNSWFSIIAGKIYKCYFNLLKY